MANFIISYTINETNNQFAHGVLWQGNIEKDTLAEAHKVFDNIKSLDETYTKNAYPYFGKITRIAIFQICGKETFQRKPRYIVDRRDKSDWIIVGLEGLINSRSSVDI